MSCDAKALHTLPALFDIPFVIGSMSTQDLNTELYLKTKADTIRSFSAVLRPFCACPGDAKALRTLPALFDIRL